MLIFDEEGYAWFQKDRKSEPLGFTLTLPDGEVEHRLPYQVWFRYSIIDAGTVSGLESLGVPEIENRSNKVAAEPGRGYFICKEISLMEFLSGKWGMGLSFELPRVYATEWILREGKQVGIKLNYTIQTIETDELPAWGTVYEVKADGEKSVKIPLSPKCKDSECIAWSNTPLCISFAENHVTIEVQDPKAAPDKEYRFFIRSGVCYTEAKIRLVK